ncbi:MAG TPA: transglutaminase family protein [Candidatus Binataceae bacterium]|nr:transglutaminase family protein [Candidatus Binataceae bacterium]
MLVRIRHATRFAYGQEARDSHNELRLRPLDAEGQRCVEYDLSIDQPAAVLPYRDFFGNNAHSVSVSAPHRELTIVSQALIERDEQVSNTYPEVTFRTFLAEDAAHIRDYCEFLNPSHYIPFSERLQKLFWQARPGDSEDVAAYVMRMVQWVRDQFDYQKARTNVHSNLDDILKSGSGVCQDFAHLTIGFLRLAGVPARYISGFLAPNKGSTDLGEQASHAWLEAWLPHAGWTGFDPTLRYRTDERHIKVAIGRDYADVPPLKGTYRSNHANQVMTVDVKVVYTSSTSLTDDLNSQAAQAQQ